MCLQQYTSGWLTTTVMLYSLELPSLHAVCESTARCFGDLAWLGYVKLNMGSTITYINFGQRDGLQRIHTFPDDLVFVWSSDQSHFPSPR